MNEAVSVSWFPGHMAKTKRQILKALPMVEAVLELRDARIPYSSRNPELSQLIGKKPVIVLLNKSDYADPNITAQWLSYYKEKNIPAMAADCRSGHGLGALPGLISEVLAPRMEKLEAKGMAGIRLGVMVVGIPNVGKSSFINRMAGGKPAKVSDRPGVTRGLQWISLDGFELLDVPGVLWPKLGDSHVGEHLAFTGAVRDEVVDTEHLACRLIGELSVDYRHCLQNRYNLEISDDQSTYDILINIGKNRGMLIKGGETDTLRAAVMLLDEFRGGKLGRISLETPKRR